MAPGEYTLKLDVRFGDAWARYADTVTLTSADRDNPAVLTSVLLHDVHNLTFDGLHFDYDGPLNETADRIVEFNGVRNVTVRDSRFTGALAEDFGPAADGFPIGAGLTVRGSENVSVVDNLFEQLFRGAVFEDVGDLVVTGNEITQMRSDGLVLSAVNDVLIEDNFIHDFRLSPSSPDHADMIQMLSHDRVEASRDIVIRGNLLHSGDGLALQSLFMRNEAYDRNQIPREEALYRNFLIEDNVIYNGHQWGIYVGQIDGLVVRNNTLLQNTRSGWQPPSIFVKPESVNVTIKNNLHHMLSGEQKSDWIVTGNVAVQANDYYGDRYYGDIFANALTGGMVTAEELQLRPGLDFGAGAASTVFDATPDALTALFTATLVDAIRGVYVLDAGLTADPDGLVTAQDAVFRWTLPDGAQAEGVTVAVDFGEPGVYPVLLEVVRNDGARDALATHLQVVDPSIFNLGWKDGALRDLSSYSIPLNVRGGPAEWVEGRGGDQAFELGEGLRVTVNHSAIPRLFNMPAFSMSFGLKAKTGETGDAGVVAFLLNSFYATVTSAGELAFSLITEDGRFVLTSVGAALMDGDWHDVTVTYDSVAGALRMTVDEDVAVVMAASGPTAPRTDDSLYIGDTWNKAFDGYVDRLEIWNYALTQNDVAALHEASPPPAPVEPPPAPVEPPPAPVEPPEAGGQTRIGEVGVLEGVDHESLRIDFGQAYDNPVVFTQTATRNGWEAITARVTDVTATGFTLRLEEPEGYDGAHVAETVSFMVLEAGLWRLGDGSLLDVGVVETAQMARGGFERVDFSGAFDGQPVALSQLQTDNEDQFAFTRHDGVQGDGFRLAIEHAEAGNGPSRGSAETVGWMALEGGAGVWDSEDEGFRFLTSGPEGGAASHDRSWTDFAGAFGAAPAFFAQIDSYNGADPSDLRAESLTANGVLLGIEEDVTADSETWHTSERVNWLAIEGEGALFGEAVI